MRSLPLRLTLTFVLAAVISIPLFSLTMGAVSAAGTATLLDPLWTFGMVGDRAAESGIIIRDLDGDGVTDTLLCTYDSPYIYHYIGQNPQKYQAVWYGERVDCSAVAAADVNDDGVEELFIGSRRGVVYRYDFDGEQYQRTFTITADTDQYVMDVAVGDVDADDEMEIVIGQSTDSRITDLAGNIEWDLTGRQGLHVAVGNLDADADPEVVLNGTTGYILNAITHTTEHTKSGGWGRVLEIGDTDNDGIDEIAYVRGTGYSGYVGVDEVVGTALVDKWEYGPGDVTWLTIGEVEASTAGTEVVTGDWHDPDDGIRVRDGITGAPGRFIENPGHSTFGMGIGDSDDDGTPEIWWGSYHDDSWGDEVFVADGTTGVYEWKNRDYEAPYLTAGGDIDNDGNYELVSLSTTSGDAYYGGVYLAYDDVTFREEVTRTTNLDPTAFVIGQLDNDAALELAIGGVQHNGTLAAVEVYDGATDILQWSAGSSYGTGGVVEMLATPLDGADNDALIVATPNDKVVVYDGASNTILWQSPVYADTLVDIAVGTPDTDGTLKLAILTESTLHIIDTDTWTEDTAITVAADNYVASQVAAGDHDALLQGEWLVAATRESTTSQGDPLVESRLSAYDGVEYGLLFSDALPAANYHELLALDLDQLPGTEFVAGGGQRLTATGEQPTALIAGKYDREGEYTTLYNTEEYWGVIGGMAVVDHLEDGVADLFIGTTSLHQLRTGAHDIEAAPPSILIAPDELNAVLPVSGEVSTTTLTVVNQGGLPLIYETYESSDATCAEESDLAWFSVAPTEATVAGSASQVHTATFSSEGLPSGTYMGTLCFASNDPDTAVAVVPVTLVVTESAPGIQVNPLSVYVQHVENETSTYPLTIHNSGAADLIWTLADSNQTCAAPSDISWLSATPLSGSTVPSATSEVTLHLDSTNLSNGIYEGLICVETNVPNLLTMEVPVRLTVGKATAVTVSSFTQVGTALPMAGAVLVLGLAVAVAIKFSRKGR